MYKFNNTNFLVNFYSSEAFFTVKKGSKNDSFERRSCESQDCGKVRPRCYKHPNYEYFNCTVVCATSACAILANAGIHPLSRLTQRTCGSSSQRVVKQAERLPDFMPQRGAVPQTPVRKVLRP